MKKRIVVFIAIALCSLLLSAVAVKAAEEGYIRIDYNPDEASPITIDGEWTNVDEWATNGENTTIGTDANLKSVWFMVATSPTFIINDTWLVEFYTDTTDDAADYFEMCFDGDQSGGSAPEETDYRILIEGYTDLTVYKGDGSGWVEDPTFPVNNLNWSSQIVATPFESTPHRVLELLFLKGDLGLGIQWNFRIAVYDADTQTLAAWPPRRWR